jgi:hypothetical protein
MMYNAINLYTNNYPELVVKSKSKLKSVGCKTQHSESEQTV